MVKDLVVNFIKENFIMGRIDVAYNPATSLIESGIIDSTGVIELVEFLAHSFGITIEDDDLVSENFDTLNNILAFLETKGVYA